MKITKVLLQGEDRLILRFLEDKKWEVAPCRNREMALKLLSEHGFDLIICDDVEILKRAKASNPQAFVIVTTEITSVENAVLAMRLGAFEYVMKPLTIDVLDEILERIEEGCEEKQLPPALPPGKMEEIMVESSVMQKLLPEIEKIAKSSASVFISGESGTGKEVIAHAIHFLSPRKNHTFVKVNCAAIAETLIESEFFGHEKGAFTGAIDKRLGRFELAHLGTLLLDEVTEIPLHIQAKLLRVIQEQEFDRVGGTKPIRVDVRLIATSNRNMKTAIEEKQFREDLYYRLNVVPIFLPPLRERKEDIVSLAEHFLRRFCMENNKKKKVFSESSKKTLLEYHWPGNIRELANVIERTVVIDLGDMIEPEHLRLEISCPVVPRYPLFQNMSLADVEKKHILEMLSLNKQNRTQAAKALGISVRTLRNKLKLYS